MATTTYPNAAMGEDASVLRVGNHSATDCPVSEGNQWVFSFGGRIVGHSCLEDSTHEAAEKLTVGRSDTEASFGCCWSPIYMRYNTYIIRIYI
jgi:hypothetical protein